MRVFVIALAAVAGLHAGAARSQDLLPPGQAVAGTAAGSGRINCYVLPTTPGSQWQVAVTASSDHFIEVGRGSCDAFTLDRSSDSSWKHLGLSDTFTHRLGFAAGGGAYLVRVRGISGTFSIIAEPRPGTATRGLLPAGGAVGPWFQRGWTPASVSSEPSNAGEGLRPRTVFKDCEDVCPELVVVAAGAFTMGSPEGEAGRHQSEGPRHPVAFRSAFAIGRYEVTFAEYDACVAAGGCTRRPNDAGWGRGRRPVRDVSWNDAMEYVAWLSEHSGRRYTLPSESEWEYAARAGTDTPWHTGRAILTDDANILNAFGKTVAVGSYPPNAFGLHDVHGNVSEWVLDCVDTGYVGVPNDGAAATSGDCSGSRVIRGGGFGNEPAAVRSAYRRRGAQSARGGVGFRVARAL